MTSEELEALPTFGALLRYLRRRARLTQRQIGIGVGYSETQINRLESGQRVPDPVAVRANFLEALGLHHGSDAAKRLVALAEEAHGTPPAMNTPATAEVTVSDASDNPARLGNLRASLAHFIGRERELADVQALLQKSRLVTLTGAGGVGKTRLAVEVGASPLDASAFPDGVWLVELAPLADPALVPRTTADVFGLPDEPGTSPQQLLIDHLRDRRLLLILDNCEHVIATCAQLVEALLRACPRVTVLATSREALRVPGEVAWRVPSLVMPDPAHLPPLAQVLDYDAVQFFIEYASAAQPGFALAPDNLAAIAQICARLDGIPLAIEMAAALVSALPVEDIAAGLDDRFALLTSGQRTALPRQQTLRATLEWSYNLLEAPERVLLARLSVFAGGATLDAARAVCTDLTPEGVVRRGDVQPLLLQLVRKSLLVTARRNGSPAGQTRYHLLETIRHFAGERLAERGEVDATYERLANHLATLEQSARIGEHPMASTHRRDAELDNVRVLMAWALVQPDANARLRIISSVGLAYMGGRMSEPLAWLAEALARGTTASPDLRLSALTAQLGLVKFSGHNLSRWATQAEEILDLVERAGDAGMKMEALFWAGAVDWDRRKYDRVAALYQRGLALAEPEPMKLGQSVASLHWGLGLVCLKAGEAAAAAAHFEECLCIGRQTDNGHAFHLGLNGLNWWDEGACLSACERELARLRLHPPTGALPRLLQTYGQPLLMAGQYTRAKEILHEALTLWNQQGQRYTSSMGSSQVLLDLGQIAWLEGDLASAQVWYEQSLEGYRQVGDMERIARLEVYIALTRLAQGDSDHVAADIRHAMNLYRELEQPTGIALALAGLAALSEARGQPGRAARLFGAASQWRDTMSVSLLWPACGIVYERALTDARVRLGSADASRAADWSAGERMTLAQAITYGLAGDPIPG